MKKDYLKSIVKKELGSKRYEHSVAVSKEAVKLAKKYGADEEKAEIAGLLHDIMKEADPKVQLKIIENSNIVLNEIEMETKKLWHQIAGMAYVKDVLKIDDEDILNAIRYHTSARADMSLLEKVIFIADFTSSDRDYSGVNKMRELSVKSLELAMIEGLSFVIQELAHENKLIVKDTIDAYNCAILCK